MEVDVLVIGGGLAGAAAALSAQSAGARVALVSRGPGATALSSGAADIAAVGDLPLLEAMRALGPAHPYALIDDLPSALSAALRFLRSLGFEGPGERNLWLLSPLGCPKPSALAQRAIAAGDLRALPHDAKPCVAALSGAQALQARLQASGLQRFVPGAFVNSTRVEFFAQRADALRTLPELAAELDKPGARAALGAALKRACAGATHLFLPTLGFAPGARAELEAAAGVPVYELLGAPPSVPGLRLQRALEQALRGVEVLQGIAERAADGGVQIVSGTRCEPIAARAIVLATGRFLGGGISGTPALRETVMQLPAYAGARRSIAPLPTEELFGHEAAGRHAGLSAGVRVGQGLRALDASMPVFAAGAVVGGYDQSRDEGGLGAAALLGLVAGAAAASKLPKEYRSIQKAVTA